MQGDRRYKYSHITLRSPHISFIIVYSQLCSSVKNTTLDIIAMQVKYIRSEITKANFI